MRINIWLGHLLLSMKGGTDTIPNGTSKRRMSEMLSTLEAWDANGISNSLSTNKIWSLQTVLSIWHQPWSIQICRIMSQSRSIWRISSKTSISMIPINTTFMWNLECNLYLVRGLLPARNGWIHSEEDLRPLWWTNWQKLISIEQTSSMQLREHKIHSAYQPSTNATIV